ncbi:hypothetical protein BTUL_0155g00200 [Botrytis tulipae]|uniref:Uncharacterized protein n=1 Tax=Botrytis tulipae TaxID=87230 RepID=A0A4Z1EBR0_9HELO|nr:hypothetical protein BTUL_0155g00200 [Botrytis tulipae]
MAQINKQEKLDIERVNNLAIKSQHGLEVAKDERASVSGTKSFHLPTRTKVPSQQPSNTTTPPIDLQFDEYSDEACPRTADPPRTRKKTFGFLKAARKARLRWKEEEKKQIALGIHSSEEIPATVDAITREAHRQYRKERKLRKCIDGKTGKFEAKNETKTMELKAASGDEDDGFGSSDGVRLPPQMENIESD